ncbi:hypothetical protein NLJ89_g6473 [Agrocybe chaxingu]|uniref:Uncharacterized protein n=1 Tax=Agrocybe chaxingu TaxID=84603 RepID=A0A9W8MUL2_9AGAR|nr:hypothetical protein NLJ89_g6473 [Agrocybe chaxingu]
MTALPQEVVDDIINGIAQEERALDLLLACSLVCRAFLPRSQKHIFHKLVIRSDEDNEKDSPGNKRRTQRIKLLLTILEERPQIAELVQHVHIQCALEMGSVLWLAKDKGLHNLMGTLRKTENPFRTFETTNMQLLTSEGELVFSRFWVPFIAPHVNTLIIDAALLLPSAFIQSCRKLTDLFLIAVFLGPSAHIRLPYESLAMQPILLDRLDSCMSSNAVPESLGWDKQNEQHKQHAIISVESLRHYRIYTAIGRGELGDQISVFQCSGKTLKTLVLDKIDPSVSDEAIKKISLYDAPNLESLALGFDYEVQTCVLFDDDEAQQVERREASIRHASTVLASSASSHLIQSLTLNATFLVRRDGRGLFPWSGQVPGLPFIMLEAALLKFRSAAAKNCKIRINIYCREIGGDIILTLCKRAGVFFTYSVLG